MMVQLASVQLNAADRQAGWVNALAAARAGIEVGDVDVACDALALQTRSSFSSGDRPDP